MRFFIVSFVAGFDRLPPYMPVPILSVLPAETDLLASLNFEPGKAKHTMSLSLLLPGRLQHKGKTINRAIRKRTLLSQEVIAWKWR